MVLIQAYLTLTIFSFVDHLLTCGGGFDGGFDDEAVDGAARDC